MQIKICGITCVEEIQFLNKMNIDYIGLVFCTSKRQVTVEKGKVLRERIKDKLVVGVFKDNSLEFIKKVYAKTKIDIIQLHGNEDLNYIKKLMEELKINKNKIWKGISIENNRSLKKLEIYKEFNILLDGKAPGEGKSFDYKILNKIKRKYFLAGGINKESIKSIPKDENIIGIDLSSGAEEIKDGKRIKSKDKINEILGEVRSYEGTI